MSLAHPSPIRGRSIRVALGATAIVGLLYLAAALAVLAVVTRDLTAQVDQRLSQAIEQISHGPSPGDHAIGRPEGDRPFGVPTLVWTIASSGTAVSDSNTPELPVAYRTISAPTTATIGGTLMRLEGAQVQHQDVIVGQSMESVSDAQATIALAEILVAPVLLVIVFLGAVAIGRRVASPIEASRRRQLDFTADASHELRTPLSVIEAHTGLALSQERDASWYRSAFGHIDQESKRMRRLLDDMLWLARFDATQSPAGAEPVDLGVLATRTADRFAAVAETRALELRVRVPDVGVSVAAPPELLDRLLGVLLDNACKYSPDHGSVEISVAREGARAVVTVDDTGPGIPPDQRGRIFDRFHRGEGVTGTQDGSGLGLAIADAIVRATGGRWAVGGSPAGGARFSVSWPRALA